VEEYIELSSEEDPDENSDKEGSLTHRSNDKNKSSKKKKKDALVNFERKMTVRLNS